MSLPTILFAPPKQGGILQSSGFLDLKSLMALGRTCKANALDELSFIVLIENELTRYHRITTKEEATKLLKSVYDNRWLKRWLEHGDRNNGDDAAPSLLSNSVTIRLLMHDAAPYEVMLVKMLCALPSEAQRLDAVSKKELGRTVLYQIVNAGNVESLKAILGLFTESQRLHLVNIRDVSGSTILHWSAYQPEAIGVILNQWPESQRLQAIGTCDNNGRTVLHYAVLSGNIESVRIILKLCPESLRPQLVNTQDRDGETILHIAARVGSLKVIRTIMEQLPESERLRALCMKDNNERNVLHWAIRGYTPIPSGDPRLVKFILTVLPESQRLSVVTLPDVKGRTALHEAARSRKSGSIYCILDLLPVSQRVLAVNVRDRKGSTALQLASEATRESIMALLPPLEKDNNRTHVSNGGT